MPAYTILPTTIADWPEICAIYREGILTNNATFNLVEHIPESGEAWFAGKLAGFVFKAVDEDGTMLGWGCLSPTSKRDVYRGVVEDSVYVAQSASGMGIGSALLAHLIQLADQSGLWTIIASIFPENEASVHIHKKHGFRVVGVREKVAKHHGRWRDVVWMERRSPNVL
ncbi:MAG: GNAT family N-acetyltransferase [Candidatus Promineifilaceae bacterium]